MLKIEQAKVCLDKGLYAHGMWMRVGICYSHLLLVVNSSVNIIIYVLRNRRFKRHFCLLAGAPLAALGCCGGAGGADAATSMGGAGGAGGTVAMATTRV